MASDAAQSDPKAFIMYYARRGYAHHISQVCQKEIKRNGQNYELRFWSIFAMVIEGQHEQSIRLFESLKRRKQVELPVICALLHVHKQCKLVDHEAVSELESELKPAEQHADEKAQLAAAQFCFLTKQISLARKLVKRALKNNPNSIPAQALMGWIELAKIGQTSSSSRRKKKKEKDSSAEAASTAIRYFESALDGAREKNLIALLGCAKYCEVMKQYTKALDHVNQVIVRYEWFFPALVMKAQTLMMMGDWDQALETAQRALEQQPDDIETLRTIALYYLVREGNSAEVETHLTELDKVLKKTEPNNAGLHLSISAPFARLAGRDKITLLLTMRLIERARDIEPDSSIYAAECADQYVMLGELDSAMKMYKRAAQLDESNIDALQGMIHCYILMGQLGDAQDQLEFFSVIEDSVGRTSQQIYLDALMAWQKDKDQAKHVQLLNDLQDLHFKALKAEEGKGVTKNSIKWFEHFNPDFLIDVSKQYMLHCGDQPLDPSAGTPELLSKASMLLQRITRAVPGSMQAKLALAKCHFITNDFESATTVLEDCIQINPAFADAHLIMARIKLHKDDFQEAAKELEEALAHSFEIRNSPVYHLVKAKVLEAKGENDKAKQILQKALELPGMSDESNQHSVHDRASIFIQLAEVHNQLNELDEASAVISRAQKLLAGTPEEVRVIISKSSLLLKQGEVKKAIKLLNSVPEDSSAWLKATMTKADIYLQHRRNKQQYTTCYMHIVERQPSKQSYILLGNAYMHIQEPDAAIGAYEAALKLEPDDVSLATMIGKALLSTHDYQNAINYYKSALEQPMKAGAAASEGPRRMSLRLALAELYTKLKKWNSAKKVLNEALQEKREQSSSGVKSMMEDVKMLLLLADVCFGSRDDSQAVEVLQRARLMQNKMLSKLRSESQQRRKQAEIAADIRYKIGNYFLQSGNEMKAPEFFKEALKYDDAHEKALLALSKIYLNSGDLTNCQLQCATLLRIDPGNKEASMMLADVMFRKNELEAATYHFQQLLEKRPDNFVVLSRMIALLWRAGKLEEGVKFIKHAKRSMPRVVHAAGFNYCQGLHHRFSMNPGEAIRYLNLARRDGEWGRKAIENMIKIYLNPAGNHMWEEDEARPDAAEALRVIESLLREPAMIPHTVYHEVLQCYADILTRSKPKIDAVLRNCVKIIEQYRTYVPALLCMSIALMMNRQAPKARNQLKRICKIPYKQEFAEEFEEAYLMLATIYIRSKKFDLALELCKRCLKHNKSCGKAWEHMGLIMEREHSYKDAAEYYEAAWKYDSQASAPVGYKLAFNYLKAKRYIDAIDVCHKVLAMFPDYPLVEVLPTQ